MDGLTTAARRHRLAIGATLAAFLVRIYRIGADPFWADEGRYVAVSAAMLRGGELLPSFPGTDIIMSGHPPMFMYFTAVVHLLGGTAEWVFRMPSVVAGTLLIPVLYVWLRHRVDRTTLRWSLAVTALFPLLIVYSREAITNMVGLFFMVAALAACDGWVRTAERRWLAVTLLVAGLAIASHQMSMLLAFLLPLYVVVMDDRPIRDRARAGLAVGLPALVLSIATHLVLTLWSISETVEGAIRDPGAGPFGPISFVLGLPIYVVQRMAAVGIQGYMEAVRDIFLHYFTRSYLYLPLVGCLLGLYGAVRHGDRFDRFLVGWIAVVGSALAVPIYAVYHTQGLPIIRGAMFISVPVLLLAVRGFASLRGRFRLGSLLVGLLIVVQLLHLPIIYTHTVPAAQDRWEDGSPTTYENRWLGCNGEEIDPVVCFPRHPVGYGEGIRWGDVSADVDAMTPADVPIYASMPGVVQYYTDRRDIGSLLCNVDHRGCDIGDWAENGDRFTLLMDNWRSDWLLSETDRAKLNASCAIEQRQWFTIYRCGVSDP